MFINIQRATRVPIHTQIEDRIRDLIVDGKLRTGDRLPSTRKLAVVLSLNRITLQTAFRRLEADGLITSQVGRGTFINRTGLPAERHPAAVQLDREALERLWGPLLKDLRLPSSVPAASLRRRTEMISFVGAAPPPDLFPALEFRRCIDFVLKRRVSEIGRIGPSDGLPSLKSYLVCWLAQNHIEASEDEILITSGCQQSMDLISRALLGPDDAFVLENPTYPGAIAAMSSSTAEQLELPINGYGPDLAALGPLGGRSRCKLICVTPNFQNPTGQTMSSSIRQQLVAIASEMRIPILEDDVFGELRYAGAQLPALRSLCPRLVIYIGSMSKVLSPGLRVGWVVGPRPLIKQLNRIKQASDLSTNLLMQAALDEFCRRDLLHLHLKRVKRIFMKRRDAMAEALHHWFPPETRWVVPDGGLSVWVSLPPECNTDELLPVAQEHGVDFLPGSVFYSRSPAYSSLRLSFALESEQRIKDGIRLLANLVNRRVSWAHQADEREGDLLRRTANVRS